MKEIVPVVLLGGIIAGSLVYFNRLSQKTRAINTINAAGVADTPLFVNRDTDYLIAWAKALREKSAYFTWKGQLYFSSTGYKKPNIS